MGHAAHPTAAGSASGWETPIWLAPSILAAATAALFVVALRLHSTPTYGVESDLLGDLVPAARAIRAGKVVAGNFEFKGPGYPLMLAASGSLFGGDDWLAARVLNVVCAAVGAWFAFLLALRFLGGAAGLFVLLGLFASPIWLRATVEAGTDMPAFALSLGATWLVLARRSRLAWAGAGLIAGFAYLTRYNAVFLLPAAGIVAALAGTRAAASDAAGTPSRGRWLPLAWYAAGFAFISLGWSILGRSLAGGALPNRNYLNVAFEIYGRGMPWDMYWTDAAKRFHSFADVIGFDPGRAARVLAGNVATRWWTDIHMLVPLWIGGPAIAGMLLAWPRRRGAWPFAVHFLLAYLVLAFVFYAERFFLYLIPFYLMGTAALLFPPPRWPWAPRERAGTAAVAPKPRRDSRRRAGSAAAAHGAARAAHPQARPSRPLWPMGLSAALGTGLLATSGWLAVAEVRGLIAMEPYETRLAGEALRRLAPAGGRVMARKPHVAYFAGMDYVAMPQVESFVELLRAAREQRADYLCFTGLEANLRPQFLLLADSALVLPGLAQVGWGMPTPTHFYVLYRFTGEPIDSAAFNAQMLLRSEEFGRRHPDQVQVQAYVGGIMIDAGRGAEAVTYLERAGALDPRNVQIIYLKALSYYHLGEYGRAAAECERATAVTRVTAPFLSMLGAVRASEGRWTDAIRSFEDASATDPTDPRPQLQWALALLVSGDVANGRRALDRCVEIAPQMAPVRDRVLAQFGAGGHADQAVVLLHRIENSTLYRLDLAQLVAEWPVL